MRSLLSLGVVILLCGIVVAQDSKMPDTPYYPLSVGNIWTYRIGDNRYQVKVAEIKTVDGKPRARLETLVEGKAIAEEEVGVTDKAVVRYTSKGKEAKPPVELLRLPPKVGETWKIDAEMIDPKSKDDKTVKQTIKGTFKAGEEKEVRVPYGSYPAVTVTGQDLEANGVKVTLTYYFAKDVGMIKQVIEMERQPKIIVELENYTRGPAK